MSANMLPSEKLKLALYRHVNVFDPLPADVSLTQLSQITGEINQGRIAERLKDLDANGRVLLSKYASGTRLFRYQFNNDQLFFETGSFLVQIAPEGRKYFEELERRSEQESEKAVSLTPAATEPLVFVSCGQSTAAECQLGQAVASLVRQQAGCNAYFAQNQATLESLTENILKRLHHALGFIAIMHPRGNVSNPNSASETSWVRGSVWIEQEIAIATFMSQALQLPMRVQAYVHESIRLEGIRDKLLLNPKSFREDSEILEHLRLLLPSWRDLALAGDSLITRDHDHEHRRLAQQKVNALSEAGKDLVYFLLHHGRTELEDLVRRCQPPPDFYEVVQQARGQGLVVDTHEGDPARPSVRYFWEVNRQFEAVLRDLLGKREARYCR